MTPIADLVEQMLARGVDGDLIVAAIRAAELSRHSTGVPVDTTAEKRRAWDRNRKAEKRKSTGNSTGVPPDTENALSLSSSIDSESVEKKERKKEIARGTKIPPDWQPNAGHLAAGKQLGFTEAEILEQAEDMRLWAQSNANRAVARKLDWDLTFLTWLRRNKPKNGVANGKKSLVEIGLELAAEVRAIERQNGIYRPDDAERGGGRSNPNDCGLFQSRNS